MSVLLTFASIVNANTLKELFDIGAERSLFLRAERAAYLSKLEVEKQSFSRLLPDLKLSANTRFSSQDQRIETDNPLTSMLEQGSSSDGKGYQIDLS